MCFKFSGAPGTRKKTTVVLAEVEVHEERAFHFGIRKEHGFRIKSVPSLASE